jgi:hypothetical protein
MFSDASAISERDPQVWCQTSRVPEEAVDNVDDFALNKVI